MGKYNWEKTNWHYFGWSNVNWPNIPGKQFVVMTVRGMVISVLERHQTLTDSQLMLLLDSEMGYSMSIKAVRNHLMTLERYGIVMPVVGEIGETPLIRPTNPLTLNNTNLAPRVEALIQPSHFMDAGFLTKGKVTQHNRKKLGVVIVAVVEVLKGETGEKSWGRKFAYVKLGKSEDTKDLIAALDLVRSSQKVTCIQTDERPLYNSNAFRAYLDTHRIRNIQNKQFGSMVFIDRIFGQWKTKYVHPFAGKIDNMTSYERIEYVVNTLNECFPDIVIGVPPISNLLGSK